MKSESINVDKEIKSIVIGMDIAVKAFNEEIDKAKLSEFHKNLLKECFALGLASSILLSIRKFICKLDKRRLKK